MYWNFYVEKDFSFLVQVSQSPLVPTSISVPGAHVSSAKVFSFENVCVAKVTGCPSSYIMSISDVFLSDTTPLRMFPVHHRPLLSSAFVF